MALLFILQPEIFCFFTLLEKHLFSFITNNQEIENESTSSAGFLDIVFYFFQVSYLLQTDTNIERLLKVQIIIPFQRFFNFQGGHFGGVCPIRGLTARGKHLFDVAPVFATLLAIFIICGFHIFIIKVFSAGTPKIQRYLGATTHLILLGYSRLY